jgi:hypothetical protein
MPVLAAGLVYMSHRRADFSVASSLPADFPPFVPCLAQAVGALLSLRPLARVDWTRAPRPTRFGAQRVGSPAPSAANCAAGNAYDPGGSQAVA